VSYPTVIRTAAPTVVQNSNPVVVQTRAVSVDSSKTNPTGEETLAEVNALRAQAGLAPFVFDPKLCDGAIACARFRAANLIEHHTGNDFSFLPPGAFANGSGTAAATSNWGWLSCCVYDNATYAGAAWWRGRDGKRYMQLFVR
jgi:hypothetical protein